MYIVHLYSMVKTFFLREDVLNLWQQLINYVNLYDLSAICRVENMPVAGAGSW
jgi:hypothetical protein